MQIANRVWRRLRPPRLNLAPPPGLRVPLQEGWVNCARPATMLDERTFRFLSVTRTIEQPADWNHPAWEKLWLYNLHYCDDLAADGAEERATWHQGLIARWLAENPAGQGNGWEPYPCSLRIVNWLKFSFSGQALSPAAQASLAVQVRWLAGSLEYHLLGNHLWANGKALLFAGVAFEGHEADQWLRVGHQVLSEQFDEQFLADGGHFERSPMYHAILLEDVLDLLQLAQLWPQRFPASLREKLSARLPSLLRWLKVMSHPDGGIALFNDAALGISGSFLVLCNYAKALGWGPMQLPLDPIEVLAQSGYIRAQAGAAVLICDVGEIGPSYLPGHAHADTLSFELSIGGRRVVVDSGTSTYAIGETRSWQRGTRAHNTVTIDEANSSEVWGGFRVARRARPSLPETATDETGMISIRGSHDGYQRLPGKVTHTREWQLRPGQLTIIDTLEGHFTKAEVALHFAEGLTPTDLNGGWRIVDTSNDKSEGLTLSITGAQASVGDALWGVGFGQEKPICRFSAAITANVIMTTLTWSGTIAQ